MEFTTISLIFIASLFAALTQKSAAETQFVQKAILFENSNPDGPYIFTQTYKSNLASENFDNRALSICITGIWLFYDIANYNQQEDAIMEFAFGENNNCSEFLHLKKKVTSLRYAGSPQDYRLDTLTVYEKAYFQGREEYTVTDMRNLHLIDQQSLIITGRSPWTVYELSDYKGNATCIKTMGKYKPSFIYSLTIANIHYNSIKSVRKGCHTSRFERPKAASFGFGHGIHT